jgi:oxygen-independent coproporphyrinogen-3 oxidase
VRSDLPASPPCAGRRTILQAIASKPAPRYTSYPTALQFTADVDADTYGAWLSEIGSEPVSLYAHVPFCRRLCWYCGCSTQATSRAEPISAYVGTLLREIDAVADTIGRRLPATSLHFGGGSPDTLAPDELEAVVTRLASRFDLASGAEIAAEIDPANVSQAWVAAAGRLGFSRMSLGVQTFAPHVQAAINRPQSFEAVSRVVGWLREAGVPSINFDLMYGLPRQTLADVEATLEAALSLRPDRLAVFGYAHVPWARAHQKLIADEDLPDAAARLEQADAAAERLAREGYVRIGLDHFALPSDPLSLAFAAGRIHRNFQGYTTDQAATLIGFGPSAISRLVQGYAQNAAATADWMRAVAAGRLATARGLVFQADDPLRAELIEQMMCYGETDLARAARRWGARPSALAAEREGIEQYRALGLLEVDGDHVRLTPLGRPLVRTVCTLFDRHFSADARRHSAAI